MTTEKNHINFVESHRVYYSAFGLWMEVISYKVANITPKGKTFQGKKFDDDLGLDYYSFK